MVHLRLRGKAFSTAVSSFIVLALSTLSALAPNATAAPRAQALDEVKLYAVYYDTYLFNEPEEAVAVINLGASAHDLVGWSLTDNEGSVVFPAYSLAPGEFVWAARTATAFQEEFGFAPTFEYGGDSDPAVPDMTGSAPTFANGGDEVILSDAGSARADVLVYEGGSTSTVGWAGPALQPYNQGFFGIEGQILYRKLDPTTGLPVADTDTAGDWAQATDDDLSGKKVQYPGWDLARYFTPLTATDSANLKVLVAPDNIFDAYLAEINAATSSIYIEGYTFNHAELSDALVARLGAGVEVRVLLEEEVVNGIEDQEKWICQQLEANGGECWFMYNDDLNDVHDRYTYQHAKFTIVDGTTLLTGSENLNGSSMPSDDKADGTFGNRGAYLVTDAPSLVAHALDIFQHDLDPANHKDVRRWDPAIDSPLPNFSPDYTTGGTGYNIQFPAPLTLSGTFDFEVVQAPENTLRPNDSLLGMVARAGAGGTVLVEQLYERKFWGPSTSDPATDPNPRLEAYIDAARRGAAVRLLLDSFYDDPADPRGNAATCAYVSSVAAGEALDLECLTGNPTGNGIHNKMVLVWDGSQGWTHTGSLNGSENSNKANRELAVQVRSSEAYDYLADVFDYDWVASGGSPIQPTPTPTPMQTNTPTPTTGPTATPTPTSTPTFTPTSTPAGAQHLLITEVFYDTPGTDSNEEWIEIYNPTGAAIALSGYKLGDEETQGGGEGMYQFPPGATIGPGQRVVVAVDAKGYRRLYHAKPDYEFVDSDRSVPDMVPYSTWASGTVALANDGDEVLLLDAADLAVDAVVYEAGSFPGVIAHPGVATGHSIERLPADQDTDDCSLDFIDQANPTPGG